MLDGDVGYIRYSGESGSQQSLLGLDSFFLVHSVPSTLHSACVASCSLSLTFPYLHPVTILTNHNRESLSPTLRVTSGYVVVS